MLFYHFSLTKFDHLKIIHPTNDKVGEISLLLSKPTKTGIKSLRKNGFISWGKVDEPYYIYTIDLKSYIGNIIEYNITSIPEEWSIREFLINNYPNEWTEEKRISLLRLETRRNKNPIWGRYKLGEGFVSRRDLYITTIDAIMNNTHWLNFNYYVNEQIKRCKELNKYYDLYAAFIPHVIIKCNADIMIKPIEIKEVK